MKAVHQSTFITTTIIVLLTSLGVNGDFRFDIEFHTYSNPTHASGKANGGCCDSGGSQNTPPDCRSDCDTYLIVCLRDVSSSGIRLPADQEDCPKGFVLTDLLTDGNTGDNLLFNSGEDFDILGEIQNPLVFANESPWMASIQVIIQVFDRDNGNDDWIDVLFITLTNSSLTLQSNYSSPTNYFGTYRFSTLSLSFRVSCADNYYGSDCTTYCLVRNDTSGHYTCSREDGSIVCNEGYFNTSTSCTECLPSFGCSLIGGYCTMPGECLCYEGYTGGNCTLAVNNIADSTTGAIAGSILVVLFLLLLSVVIILVVCVTISKRRRGQSHEIRPRAGKSTGYQENASYIDLISRDALTRSTELTISDSMDFDNEESQTPIGDTHSEAVTQKSFNTSVEQNKSYKIVVDSRMSQPSCQNPSYTDYENPELERQSSENTSYSVIENSIANNESKCESDESTRPLSENPSYRNNSAYDPTGEEAAIPLRRNTSYRMLDIGEEGASISETGGQTETVYSYPKIRHSHSNTQEHIPNSDCDVPSADPYSKIELSNMYENLQPEDNMTANGMYGEFDGEGFIAIAEDPYH